ncbi:prolyl aminopeptidase [uncultured Paraglaciecola sp.]|uniref:prolyl aminopeptidase n=1 Tax=uncultured Paraglaciecola sp. TaxID=1765024 RepID=UPI0030D94A8E|tara:strand:+ start:54091 stop:55059 length:969 start_codon:yes stop_codon:yes gene_type:complete
MTQLFPDIQPFASEMLDVSHGHSLYVEQTGNAKGIPVLFLHGGPGAGIGKDYRRFFDPEKYWIIGFDQRGCGKSQPFGELENNNSHALVDDVLIIQKHLNVKKWVLFGGSWGSTLALLVALRQPESVIGLILRGIFLAREQDYDWYLEASGGAAQLFPEYYQDFLMPIKGKPADVPIVDAYYQIFKSDNEVQKMAAIKAWCLWEARISRLHCQFDESELVSDVHSAISLALLECHYIKHQCFIAENHILQNIEKIQHLPASIIHGRYDSVCKIEGAYTLSRAWQNSQLNIVPESGHSSGERLITQALCSASQAMAKFWQEQQ